MLPAFFYLAGIEMKRMAAFNILVLSCHKSY